MIQRIIVKKAKFKWNDIKEKMRKERRKIVPEIKKKIWLNEFGRNTETIKRKTNIISEIYMPKQKWMYK